MLCSPGCGPEPEQLLLPTFAGSQHNPATSYFLSGLFLCLGKTGGWDFRMPPGFLWGCPHPFMAPPMCGPGTCWLLDRAAAPSISLCWLSQLCVPAEVVHKANIQHKRAKPYRLHQQVAAHLLFLICAAFIFLVRD